MIAGQLVGTSWLEVYAKILQENIKNMQDMTDLVRKPENEKECAS